jgi:exodeoxyribonuclease-5
VFSDPESVDAAVPVIEIAGSSTRGTILHKLMEEVLSGETQDTGAELECRATERLAQLGREPSADPKSGISPKEMAATVARILSLPEIAALRPLLTPELTVFGSESDGRNETLDSGHGSMSKLGNPAGIAGEPAALAYHRPGEQYGPQHKGTGRSQPSRSRNPP